MARSFLLCTLLFLFLAMAVSCNRSEKRMLEEKLIAENKIVVLNFWAIFCTPCLAELPVLSALHKKYENRKEVAVLALALNSQREMDNFKSGDTTNIFGKLYYQSFKKTALGVPILPYLQYDSDIDTLSRRVSTNALNQELQQQLMAKYKLRGVPTTIIFFNGRECKRITGFSGDSVQVYREIVSTVDSLMNK